jgi:hypothetical protein
MPIYSGGDNRHNPYAVRMVLAAARCYVLVKMEPPQDSD